jgi:hypothetical protein
MIYSDYGPRNNIQKKYQFSASINRSLYQFEKDKPIVLYFHLKIQLKPSANSNHFHLNM